MMSVLPLSLFLLFLLTDLSQAKRDKSEKARFPPSSSSSSFPPSPGAQSRSVIGSGELTSKGGHGCTWQTSGVGLVSLLVNCSFQTDGETHRYWCRFAGKPDLCPNYSLKSSQYWKQLVGKLKKRTDVCRGEKTLKAKTCKKAPTEAHMKLAQSSREEEEEERKKRKEEEEQRRRDSEEEGVLNDMQPLQSFCDEGWSSVCSFLVKAFHG